MQNPKQWRQQINHDYGPEHPLYGLVSQMLSDWEHFQRVWTEILNEQETQLYEYRARFAQIRELVK